MSYERERLKKRKLIKRLLCLIRKDKMRILIRFLVGGIEFEVGIEFINEV